jgi:hypothetical protein
MAQPASRKPSLDVSEDADPRLITEAAMKRFISKARA